MPISFSSLGGGAQSALTSDQLILNPDEQFAVSIPTINTDFYISAGAFFGAGVYRLRFFPTNISQPTVSIIQRNSTFGTVNSAITFGDPDSGSTVNEVLLFLTITGSEFGWSITSNQIGYLVVEKTSIPATATVFSTLETVTTSGSVEFKSTTKCVLIGGGGGGAASFGGGGGSGYQTRFDAPAGTYTLVVGSGGGPAGNGGGSSFSGAGITTQTANGGLPGSGRNGGNGGSGGGYGSWGTNANGAPGGSNGSSGGSSPNGAAGAVSGTGSAVTLTGYLPGLTAGAGGTAGLTAGGAGGLYGGGGGGGGGNAVNGGDAAPGTGGGGGGGAGGAVSGGAGGSGLLLHYRWGA